VSYSLHLDARQDVEVALAFYAKRAGFAVGQRFFSEFERVAALLVRHPGLGTPTKKGRRVYPLRTFPFSVIYECLEAEIRIVVLRHQHRRPNYGMGRV
jgi:plasmid stabilization system protein ParE